MRTIKKIRLKLSHDKSYISKHLLAGIRLHLREIEAHSVIQTVWVMGGGAALNSIIVLPWRGDIKWTSCTQPRGGALKLLCNKKQNMEMRSLLCCIMHFWWISVHCPFAQTQISRSKLLMVSNLLWHITHNMHIDNCTIHDFEKTLFQLKQ